jgi:RNA polymerase sigma-70 factor (ECF subfamily)
MTDPIDHIMLQRLQNGDPKAFECVFLAYYGKVKNFIDAIIKSETDAENLAQDIFVKLWNNREALDLQKSFHSYIYTIARNLAFNYIKHQNVCNAYLAERPYRDTDITPEDMIYAKETALLIEMAVEKMTEQQRRIYRLSRNEELTHEEIADRLNISKKTVENQLSIVLRKLKKVVSTFLLLIA